ncbi:MAG TPA: hypothetical protein VGL29_04120, partial [Blastocatellia bacterium]
AVLRTKDMVNQIADVSVTHAMPPVQPSLDSQPLKTLESTTTSAFDIVAEHGPETHCLPGEWRAS